MQLAKMDIRVRAVGNFSSLLAPVDKIVRDYVDQLLALDPKFIEGIYLTGSVSLNDFHPDKSDIDFLVICKMLPDEKILAQLNVLHQYIERKYPKPVLNGYYLTSACMQDTDPEKNIILNYHEGILHYESFGMAAISLSELKTNAITITGQSAATLPVTIQPAYLQNFLYRNIHSYWKTWIKQHSNFLGKKILLLLFPRLTEWVVLGVARQYCTLKTGKIVSKTEAGRYCLQHLPDKFHPIIKEAMEIRMDKRTYPIVSSYAIRLSFRRTKETIECVKYLINGFTT